MWWDLAIDRWKHDAPPAQLSDIFEIWECLGLAPCKLLWPSTTEQKREAVKGGFIPTVDHQTPPHVSLDHYRGHLTLLREYAVKGAQ